MMIEEFEQRTGYFPSSAEYKAIEAAYMEFDGDKDEFCKAYKKNANGIAERIRREVNAAAFKESRQHTADLTRGSHTRTLTPSAKRTTTSSPPRAARTR